MVDNQEQDDKSQFLIKKQKSGPSEPVHEAGELKIWVNLQIPRNDEGFEEMNKDQKICHVCNKGFLSGKALGGHMRIHSKHESSNSSGVIVPLKESSTCAECGKYFSSTKALSGHMRCHPDRGYRGIRPPPLMNETSSYSSSENDDDDDDDEGDCYDRREVTDKKISTVDLVESLKGWSATARRGRRVSTSASETSSSMEDDKLRGAADDLMMLAQKGKIDIKEVSQLKLQLEANEEYKGYEVGKSFAGGESVEKLEGHDHHLSDEINGQSVVGNTLGEKIKGNKRKRRVKVLKLADLDSTTPLNLDLKYKCNTCGKSFSTHQALGGHMSSHNKVIKFTIQNSVDKPVTISKVALQGEAREKYHIDFDLNVKLPSDDEDGFHQPQNVNFG